MGPVEVTIIGFIAVIAAVAAPSVYSMVKYWIMPTPAKNNDS